MIDGIKVLNPEQAASLQHFIDLYLGVANITNFYFRGDLLQRLAYEPESTVFFRYRMACVGCPIASFETLAEVAVIYRLDLDRFMSELRQTIRIKEDAHSYNV